MYIHLVFEVAEQGLEVELAEGILPIIIRRRRRILVVVVVVVVVCYVVVYYSI